MVYRLSHTYTYYILIYRTYLTTYKYLLKVITSTYVHLNAPTHMPVIPLESVPQKSYPNKAAPRDRLLMKVRASTSTAAAILQPTQRKRISETMCKTPPWERKRNGVIKKGVMKPQTWLVVNEPHTVSYINENLSLRYHDRPQFHAISPTWPIGSSQHISWFIRC